VVNVAVLGYGITGRGIVEVFAGNEESIRKQARDVVRIKYILCDNPPAGGVGNIIFTDNFDDILNDDEVQIVAEVSGERNPAYEYIIRALLKGKHICTSNKQVVVQYGSELIEMAKTHGLNFMFEATVGGGIPIIRAVSQALVSDRIVEISGILNATSNYIMTKMFEFDRSYESAFAEAVLGDFVERKSNDDVSGRDAARKLAILLAIALGKQTDYRKVLTDGIDTIRSIDLAFARTFGYILKPCVHAILTEDTAFGLSVPMLLPSDFPLATVNDTYNGIIIKSAAAGPLMFYGQGTGKFPVAAAVISDIVDIAKHLDISNSFPLSRDNAKMLSLDNYASRKMIRAFADSVKDLDNVNFMELTDYPGQVAWLTDHETEKETHKKLKGIRIEKMIRIFNT